MSSHKPVDYLHITEHGGLEVCNSTHLQNNNLNGHLLHPGFLAETDAFIETTIAKLVFRYNIGYLVISADPFCLPERHSRLFSSVPLPKGLILCDTHHGKQPVSRSLRFCINSKIQSVLLRFNQRHAHFFRQNGIWSDATVLSPDLHQIALAKLRLLSATSPAIRSKPKTCSNHTSSDYKATLSSPGLFVGSVARLHPFRSHQFALLRSGDVEIDVRRTPNVQQMIESLSAYAWGLNLPLNGDFNRRFIEILLADVPVLSESLPLSQCHFPFSLLLRHAIFFDYEHGLQQIQIRCPPLISTSPMPKLSPLQELLRLVRSGYDSSILSSFDLSLRQDLSGQITDFSQSTYADLQVYDICLENNINPLAIARHDAYQLLDHANSISQKLNLNVHDEFMRLNSYAMG